MATKKATAKKAASKKTSVKEVAAKTAAKKTSATKTAAKKNTTQKAPARKSVSGSAAKKTAAKAPKNVPAQRSAPKKTSSAEKYSDPALRERIKTKVIREGKGGRPGQWSARKAQMVAHEYESAGGTYKGGRDSTQESLTEWGEEHWTTQDGKPARRADGMHRYLPEKAWEELSPAEKRSTEKKKLAGDRKGKQFVANTGPAVKARHDAEKKPRAR